MNIICKYKQSTDGTEPCILCKIRLPFKSKLSDDDKNEIISSLCDLRNVPERFTDIHEAIKGIHFSISNYLRKDMVLTTSTKDGSCYVDIIVKFSSLSKLNNFVEENHLVAEPF